MKFFISHEFAIILIGSLFSFILAYTKGNVADGIVFYFIVLTSLASTGISGYKHSYGVILFSIKFIINTAITYVLTYAFYYFIGLIIIIFFAKILFKLCYAAMIRNSPGLSNVRYRTAVLDNIRKS